MDLAHTRQKAREALECLTADSPLDERLANAGMVLGQVLANELPWEAQRKLLIARRAFTMYPEAWRTRPGWDGDIAALISLLPHMRKRKLVEMVCDLFETVCSLRTAGRGPAGQPQDQGLRSPDKWEFLFWNLGHTDPQPLKDDYVSYASSWLPNLPPAVLLEWPGRHGCQGFRDWAHLDLERLAFEDTALPFPVLEQIQAIDPGFLEVGSNSLGHHHLHREGDWIGQYIREHGTWSAPIIVLQQTSPATISGRSINPGMVLIEGHQRLSRLLNWPDARGRDHRVMLGRLL